MVKKDISRKDLEEYIKYFFGYGNLKSKMWFIGMEEGGLKTEEELNIRIETWKKLKNHAIGNTLSVREFHQQIPDYKGLFFVNNQDYSNVKLKQPTWRGIIRIILGYLGQDDEKINIRKYQNDKLGELGGENCLIELFPLPIAKSKNSLFSDTYGNLIKRFPDIFGDENVDNKEFYKEGCYVNRKSMLETFIRDAEPEFIVMYGSGYTDYWKEITGINKTSDIDIEMGNGKKTNITYSLKEDNNLNINLFIIPHITKRGLTGIFFKELGKFIKNPVV